MRRELATIVLALSLLLAGCVGGQDPHEFNGDEFESAPAAFQFTLTDQNGDEWSLSQTKGNVTIVAFVFTRCPDVCLALTANVIWVLEHLSEADRAKVSVVSVTIDPWSDSPTVMNQFATDRGADWPHLTTADAGDREGEYPELEAVWAEYGIGLEAYDVDGGEDYLLIHAQPTFILDRDHNKRVVWQGSEWEPTLFKQDLEYIITEPIEG